MKKCILLMVILMLLTALTNAQYKINKTKYDHHTYSYQVGDPYNPSVAGVTSFLLPGLGQMLSGEGGRGVAFLGGYLGSVVIYAVGAATSVNDIDDGGTGSSGAGLMAVGLIGAIGVDIWAIVDAVRVAKVNNLAFRDQNKTSSNLSISPYLNTSMYNSNKQLITGISLKYSF